MGSKAPRIRAEGPERSPERAAPARAYGGARQDYNGPWDVQLPTETAAEWPTR
jgi:hypothetical protein